MRRGFDGLSRQVQQVLGHDPFSGHLFVFRGRRGDLLKVLYWDTQGLCLFAKRLERGRLDFVRSSAEIAIDGERWGVGFIQGAPRRLARAKAEVA